MSIEKLIQRDEDGIAHLVGLSGGKDSTAMALWLAENEPRPYNYIITPTGDELPEMFAHWRKLGKLLGRPLLPVGQKTLAGVIEEQKAIPNWNMRFCTRLLKLAPYAHLLGAVMPAVSYIGLRADEEAREGATHGGDFVPKSQADGLTQRFPFREIGWGVDEVWDYLRKNDMEIPERTDCARCFFQRIGEWYLLWRDHLTIYLDAEADEARWGHTYRSSQRDTWPAGLKEMRERFESGDVPEISLRMMDKRKGMCRRCSL